MFSKLLKKWKLVFLIGLAIVVISILLNLIFFKRFSMHGIEGVAYVYVILFALGSFLLIWNVWKGNENLHILFIAALVLTVPIIAISLTTYIHNGIILIAFYVMVITLIAAGIAIGVIRCLKLKKMVNKKTLAFLLGVLLLIGFCFYMNQTVFPYLYGNTYIYKIVETSDRSTPDQSLTLTFGKDTVTMSYNSYVYNSRLNTKLLDSGSSYSMKREYTCTRGGALIIDGNKYSYSKDKNDGVTFSMFYLQNKADYLAVLLDVYDQAFFSHQYGHSISRWEEWTSKPDPESQY